MWRDIYCMRTIPEHPHQCEKVKLQSAYNGRSTSLGKPFRELLNSAIPFPLDMNMQTHLRLYLQKWMKAQDTPGAMQGISPAWQWELSLNADAPLPSILRVPIQVLQPQQDILRLEIPPLVPTEAIKAPLGTTAVHWKIVSACCDTQQLAAMGNNMYEFTMMYDNQALPGQTIELPLQSGEGLLTLVVVALRFETAGMQVTDKRWLPCDVVGGVGGRVAAVLNPLQREAVL